MSAVEQLIAIETIETNWKLPTEVFDTTTAGLPVFAVSIVGQS